MTEFILNLRAEEHEKLLRSGYVEIDDPDRGHLKVWYLFDESSPGVIGKHGRLKILRPGSAAISKR